MGRIAAVFIATGIVVSQAIAQEIPRPAAEFAIHMNNQSQMLLSQFNGKIVLMAFMYTTCPHCQHAVPILNGIQKDYASKGVQILGATYNDGAEQLVADFISRFQPAFPVGWAPRETVQEFVQHPPWKRAYVPEFVFIDRKRTVREQHSGEEDYFKDVEKSVRASLDALLKEQMESKKSAAPAKKMVKKTS